MRSLVAYDDLPHTPQGLAQASHAKRRRCDAPYVGPHWDDAAPDLDDAVIASPHHEPSFFTSDAHVPMSSHAWTAEDVWDDTFLVDVWHAAEQEYRDFHARRTDALERDSLWHALPPVGASIVPPPPPPLPEQPQPAEAESATPGWHEAQRIVRTTPNAIGGDRFQNAAMAWYYAGYYTALYQAPT